MAKRIVTLVASLVLLFAIAVPAKAAPPQTSEQPIIIGGPDFDNGVAVFWNMTRDDACKFFPAPPPAIEPVKVKEIVAGQEAVVFSFRATRPLELWKLDADADGSGPCADTDDQAGAWARGEAKVTLHDNDLTASLTRGRSFGFTLVGKVQDADGQRWQYLTKVQNTLDREDVFTNRVGRSKLTKMGG